MADGRQKMLGRNIKIENCDLKLGKLYIKNKKLIKVLNFNNKWIKSAFMKNRFKLSILRMLKMNFS